jgi:hypothetical protein
VIGGTPFFHQKLILSLFFARQSVEGEEFPGSQFWARGLSEGAGLNIWLIWLYICD